MLPPGYTAVHNSRLPWTVLFNLFCFVLCVCFVPCIFVYFFVVGFFVVGFFVLYNETVFMQYNERFHRVKRQICGNMKMAFFLKLSYSKVRASFTYLGRDGHL